jgi:hypothetical protein
MTQTGALTQLYLSGAARKEDLRNGFFYTPVGVFEGNNNGQMRRAGQGVVGMDGESPREA